MFTLYADPRTFGPRSNYQFDFVRGVEEKVWEKDGSNRTGQVIVPRLGWWNAEMQVIEEEIHSIELPAIGNSIPWLRVISLSSAQHNNTTPNP